MPTPAVACTSAMVAGETSKEAQSGGSAYKRKALDSLYIRLAQVVKIWKCATCLRQTVLPLRRGGARLILTANNSPSLRKTEIEYYAMLSKTGAHYYI